MLTIQTSLALALATFLIVRFVRGLKDVGHLPGYRPMLSPMSAMGAMLPYSWWNLGINWTWELRKTAYFNHTHDIISIVPWLVGKPVYYVGCPLVSQQLLGNEGRKMLIKPREFTTPFLLWGENLFSASGAMWKRHRRVMAPAFGAKMNFMVLEQTSAVFREMVDSEGLANDGSIAISDFYKLPSRLTFLVLARCGFGLHLPWSVDERESVNDTSINRALSLVTSTSIARLVIPDWVYKIPNAKLRKIDHAWKSVALFMAQFAGDRAEELNQDPSLLEKRVDVFTRLVAAQQGDGKDKLEQDEVFGNAFLLMSAGQETTAVAVTATFAYLGVYLDEQDRAYQEILSVIYDDRDLTLEDLSQLPHTVACFYEATRLIPPPTILTRSLSEDTIIKVRHPEERTMCLKKDSLVMIDMISLHRNPNIYSDPDSFKPSRWHGVSEHEVTMFGQGPRTCIGRKFSVTEAMAMLVLLLRTWKVEVILENGETRQQYEARVLGQAGRVGLTFGVQGPVKLRLTKRKQL